MAAVNIARPPSRQQPPTATGSWDDLLRNKGKDKAAQARVPTAENRRSQSSDRGFVAHGRPRSGQGRGDFVPVRPRTMSHNAEHRTSHSFAAQVATVNGSPSSPLSQEVTIGQDAETDEKTHQASQQNLPNQHNRHSNNRRPDQPSQPNEPPMQRPSMYARPRRVSYGRNMSGTGSSTAGGEGFQSFDSMVSTDGRVRSNSWGGMPSIDEAATFQTFPPANGTARHPGVRWQQRPELMKQMHQRQGPNDQFDRLPSEVLSLILDHLKKLHLTEGNNSCTTCWMRDCCSVAMCSRGWLEIARKALYSDIQLVGQDSKQQRKKWDGLYMPRLVLLRRSLRANMDLAPLVRSLKVPALPDDAPIATWEYHDMVASVVMACPNLERMDGFYPSYRHGSESRFFHALSTRRELKEMTWVIEAAPEASVEDHRARASKSKKRYPKHSTAPRTSTHPHDYLERALANQFVSRHDLWDQLSHLTIHCLPGSNFSPPGLINAICARLPSLDSLYLSQVPARSFNDESLRTLPTVLKKLSLYSCAGVTTAGLSIFATRASASEMETLTLVHQNIDSLPTLVRILSHLRKLTTFNLVQAAAPTMIDDMFMFMPYLASQSLKRLHWDIFESGVVNLTGEGGSVTRADDILSRSISANGFPNLRSLRVLNDPEGRFQALCRPKERVDLPGDRLHDGLVNQATTGRPFTSGNTNVSSTDVSNNGSRIDLAFAAIPDSPGGRRCSSETKDSGKVLTLPSRECGSDLCQARLAAQARLEAARRFPKFEASITDEDGKLLSSEGLAGFIGDVHSQIYYCLAPDVGGSDERGGLVDIAEVLGDGGEDLFGQGDLSTQAGGGFGAGTVPTSAMSGPGEETVKGKLTKSKTSGGNGKGARGDGDMTKAKAKEGCTGEWNNEDGESVVDKKGAKVDRWWHMERGLWRGRVALS